MWEDCINTNSLYQKFKLEDVNRYEVGKFMFLCHVKALPEVFQTYFLTLDKAQKYNTRNNSNKNCLLQSEQILAKTPLNFMMLKFAIKYL